jgi:hypothetical protein
MVTRRSRRRRLLVVLVCAFSLVFAVAARAAVVGLPSDGSQVNNDPAAGIDPSKDISGDNPAADVVGGSLAPGGVQVPWAIFRQTETPSNDQIFVRSFANGAWTTRGRGTVGGRSSGAPTFPGSLNFDQTSDGEAPEVDFAGAGRNVPWATWYEDTSGTGFGGHQNIFASRFDPASGNWIFAGQGRGTGGSGPPVPSLNIHTDQSAENPSVAGGSALDPTKPGPWVTWQETANDNGKNQIFVERPLGPGQANCDGIHPLGLNDGTGDVPAVGGFCWQQTGIPRAGTGAADPSLNVDPTRDGIEPDIAFTGNNDSVPWVVWYEQNPTGTTAPNKLRDNELVFAAKGISDGVGANGGFHWQVVGNNTTGTLDATGTRAFGSCAADPTVEGNCSLNSSPDVDAEDPRVAAGTMNPANATVPWVVWDEDVGGQTKIFVSRLVGGTNFVIANGGQAISTLAGNGAGNATRPDITFSGNTPYVSWRHTFGIGDTRAFLGHLVNAANPTFVLDTPNGVPVTDADVRAPISSGCIATPFNEDGKNCSGGAIGTPFFLFRGPPGARLFGQAYQPTGVSTGGASGVGQTTATVNGSVNPEGAAVRAHFDFGATTAYGSRTADQSVGVANSTQTFAAGLSGLPAGTTIHYRAVVTTDFGSQTGADQTFTTASAAGGGGATTTNPPTALPVIPVATVDRTPPTLTLRLGRITLKRLLKTRKLPITVTADEASTDVIKATTAVRSASKASAAAKKKKRRKAKNVTVASGTVTFTGPGTKTASLSVTGGGARALKHRHSAKLTFTIKATDTSGNSRTTTAVASVR